MCVNRRQIDPNVKKDKVGPAQFGAWEAQVVGQLQQICGEPTTWSTKKKVIDQFKASVMWDGWISAGLNERQLVNFISRLQAKHLNQVGGAQSGAADVYIYIYTHTHTYIYMYIWRVIHW